MTRGPSSCSARSSGSADRESTNPPITWPPSKPISTRTRSPLLIRHHLRENTVDRVGMHERDLETEHAAPRLGVDQLGARVGELREGGTDVLDLVRDVVHTGPAPCEEPADGRVLAESREQLHPVAADPHRGGLDALLVDALPVLEPAAEEPLVGGHRVVEVVHGDADVVNSARLHQGDVSVRRPWHAAGSSSSPSASSQSAPCSPAAAGAAAAAVGA